MVDAPLSPQILLKCPASDPSFLAALAPDATGARVSPVECAVSAAAADDAAPADDSRAPTAPLAGAAEGTVSLVAGAAVNAAASSAGAGALAAPPTDVVGKTVSLVSGAAFDAAVSSAGGAGALAAPPPTQWGKQYRQSPALPSMPLFCLQERGSSAAAAETAHSTGDTTALVASGARAARKLG